MQHHNNNTYMEEIFAANGTLNQAITGVNDILWSYIIIGALIACALWFTFKTKGVQFRMIGEMVRLLGDGVKKDGEHHISSFQAFAVSIASRVGTGNLAGVATAIAVGGPGSVFWMWIIALLGSATAFVESTLAQLYKRKHGKHFIGGPAYYIWYGLHSKWMARVFAILITITFSMAYISIQSNTICSAIDKAFGINPSIMGIVLVVLSVLCVFGGIQRIARISGILVPIMAVLYILLALFIICTNISAIPHIMKIIFENAFGIEQFAGGTLGATMMNGIKRGLFSNEAGEGSAPNIAASADVSHPVKQGLVQALGVFTDTLLICSCTAFIILLSGVYETPEMGGIQLTQNALQSQVGNLGTTFVAIAIFLFAFSSIIGNYTYGEMNVRFLSDKKIWLFLLRLMNGAVMVYFGAIASLELAWSLGDLFMGLVTLCNLIAIVMLGKHCFFLLDDYINQKRKGIKRPTFNRKQIPEIESDLDCWEE